MLGLDRAAVWVELEVEADLVIIGIKKYFKAVQPKKLSGKTQTFIVNQDNINEIRVREKPLKTMIKIDFSYSRFNRNDNLYPLSNEVQKILVEEKIVQIINRISLSEITRNNLKYDYLEISIQEEIDSFYNYHNIFSLFYKALSRNFKTLDKMIFTNYDVLEDYFYSTGFIFQVDHGWKIRLYSKSHEHNKKNQTKSLKPILRLEHRISSGMLKRLYLTNQVKELSIEHLKKVISQTIGKKFVLFLQEELERDITFLREKFKDFTSRTLRTLVRDYQEHIFDEKIVNSVVMELSKKSLAQNKRYRKIVKIALEEYQIRGSPRRNNFDNIKRLEFFIQKILLINIQVKCEYMKHLTFNML